MSDQVKIGGDSTELISAIDRAEQRFARFDQTVNKSAENAGNKWQRMVEGQRAMAARIGNNADPIALATAEQKRLDAVVDNVLIQNTRRLNASGKSRGGGGDEHQSARIAGDLINIATASSGAVMRVNALSHVLGGIGPAAGLLFAATAITKIHDTAKEAQMAVHALDREFSKRPGDVVGQGSESSIIDQIQRDDKLAQTALDKLGRVNSDSGILKRFVRQPLDVISGVDAFVTGPERDDVRKRTADRRKQLEKSLLERAAEKTSIAAEEASGDSRDAALRAADQRNDERKSARDLLPNLSRQKKSQLNDEDDKQTAIEKDQIDRNFGAKEREYALAKKLNDLRANGGSEVDAARARQAAALADLNDAKGRGNDEDVKAAEAKISTAGAEIAIANQKKDILESEIRIANFRGSQEEAIKNALQEQLAAAAKILDLDQRRAAVAAANKAIREHELDVTLKQIEMLGEIDQAQIQTKAAEESVNASPEQTQRTSLQANVDKAGRDLGSASDQVEAEKNASGDASDAAVKKQILAFNQLKQAQAALNKFEVDNAFEHDQTLRAAKATTKEMQLQATGQDHLATLAGIREGYEGKIAQHVHDQRVDLAGQASTQQTLARLSAKANELAKSPGQKRAEYLDGLAHARNFKTAATQEKDELDQEQKKSDEKYGFNKRFHPERVPKSVRDDDAKRAERRKQLDDVLDPDRKKRNPERLSDDEWHNQFRRRNEPLRDAADKDRSKSAKAEGQAGKDDNSLVGKIDNLISTLNTLPAKIGVL